MATAICEYCGNTFERNSYDIKRSKHNFCSLECFGMFRRKHNQIIVENNIAKIKIKSKKHGIQYCLIDLEDIDKMNNFLLFLNSKSSKTIYVICQDRKTRKKYQLHRIIMNAPENFDVDHINHNGLDNRKSNLRICTKSVNSFNRRMQSNNTTGVIGVYKDNSRFSSYICINRKQINLGRFDNFVDAINARKEAENKYFPGVRYE